MIDRSKTSNFSILPDDLAAQYRLRYQQRQTLKALVFPCQEYQLALPMAAAIKVIPISPSIQEEMILRSHLEFRGVVTQMVTLPMGWGCEPEIEYQEEDSFIVLLTVPDGRLLGLPVVSMPNVMELPLHWFSELESSPENLSGIPFRSWVKFMARPDLEEGQPSDLQVFYLLDLELLQVYFPAIAPMEELPQN